MCGTQIELLHDWSNKRGGFDDSARNGLHNLFELWQRGCRGEHQVIHIASHCVNFNCIVVFQIEPATKQANPKNLKFAR